MWFKKRGNKIGLSKDDPKRSAILNAIKKLQYASDLINEYYSIQVVLNTTTGFLCITINIYYLIDNLSKIQYIGFDAGRMLVSIQYVAHHLTEFCVIFYLGSRVKNNWSSLYYQVHLRKLETNDDIQYGNQINEILNVMSARPIEFNAFNLFPIDMTFMVGFVSAETTYLVVLLQFKDTEDNSIKSSGKNITTDIMKL